MYYLSLKTNLFSKKAIFLYQLALFSMAAGFILLLCKNSSNDEDFDL